MNKDGWPVAAPYRYAGEPDTHIPAAAASGAYKLIQHGKDITATIKTPKNIQLNNDGTISGEMTGTWTITDSSKARINLNGTNYGGVFLKEWDSAREKEGVTFSVLSGDGEAVWGVK